ncbi:MAG TPA: hypothetical protein PK295_03550 [Candidatus Magasanikbacteria bacterium]|nr:hypothetical protein [Candidatus Magasanikbacteria bacterium]
MLSLTDLHQVTQIYYDPEYGNARLWTGHSAEHRKPLNLENNTALNGLPLVLEIMSAVTGNMFIESPDGVFYRADTPEGRRLRQAKLETQRQIA